MIGMKGPKVIVGVSEFKALLPQNHLNRKSALSSARLVNFTNDFTFIAWLNPERDSRMSSVRICVTELW